MVQTQGPIVDNTSHQIIVPLQCCMRSLCCLTDTVQQHPASVNRYPRGWRGHSPSVRGRLSWLRGPYPVAGWHPWATCALVPESLSICQAIKADGKQDNASELLENIPPRVQRGKCLKFENNLIEYLIYHQRPKLGRLTHGNERPVWPV